jgi:hypothetical protein
MGEKDGDREKDYSPNPPFVIGWGNAEHPDAEKARLHDHHKRAGTMETFYEMYPLDRPPSRDRER